MHEDVNKPNFFIVGAPKCGTTSLYRWLKQDPNVFMPAKKEPLYFCDDVREKSRELGSQQYFDVWSKEEYLNLFAEAENETAVGEASTWYLFSEVAAENIHDFNPDARIIIMLRDPVEQIISSYQYGLSKGDETADSLRKALTLEEKRKNNPPAGQFPYSYLYTEVASYADQIRRYQNTFPDKQMKIILLDDLKKDPQAVYQDVLSFLGVDNADFSPDFSQENVGVSPRSVWLNKIIKHPRSPVRKLAEALPDTSKQKARSLVNAFLLSSKNSSEVAEEVKAKLKDSFRPEVENTSKLIGKDLSDLWGYNRV